MFPWFIFNNLFTPRERDVEDIDTLNFNISNLRIRRLSVLRDAMFNLYEKYNSQIMDENAKVIMVSKYDYNRAKLVHRLYGELYGRQHVGGYDDPLCLTTPYGAKEIVIQ